MSCLLPAPELELRSLSFDGSFESYCSSSWFLKEINCEGGVHPYPMPVKPADTYVGT